MRSANFAIINVQFVTAKSRSVRVSGERTAAGPHALIVLRVLRQLGVAEDLALLAMLLMRMKTARRSKGIGCLRGGDGRQHTKSRNNEQR